MELKVGLEVVPRECVWMKGRPKGQIRVQEEPERTKEEEREMRTVWDLEAQLESVSRKRK